MQSGGRPSTRGARTSLLNRLQRSGGARATPAGNLQFGRYDDERDKPTICLRSNPFCRYPVVSADRRDSGQVTILREKHPRCGERASAGGTSRAVKRRQGQYQLRNMAPGTYGAVSRASRPGTARARSRPAGQVLDFPMEVASA